MGKVKGKKAPGVTCASFDTNSYQIAVDLGALYYISFDKNDFEGKILLTKRTIYGIASGLPSTGIGTIK